MNPATKNNLRLRQRRSTCRCRFSLRAALIIVTLFACGFAWVAIQRREAKWQAKAVAAIEQAGGWVRYDGEQGALWLRKKYGRHYFDTVEMVSIPSDYHWLEKLPLLRSVEVIGPFGDDAVDHLLTLRRIEEVVLRETDISSRGIERLNALPLRNLHISSCHLTESSAEALAELSSLTSVAFTYSRVGSGALSELARLPHLRVLDLEGCTLPDDIFDKLRGGDAFPSLTGLNLAGTNVDDLALEQLASVVDLTELGLGRTKITDEGLARLRGMQNLQFLYLEYTEITDDGVVQNIAAMPAITELDLVGTKITKAGLDALLHLPELRLLHLPLPPHPHPDLQQVHTVMLRGKRFVCPKTGVRLTYQTHDSEYAIHNGVQRRPFSVTDLP